MKESPDQPKTEEVTVDLSSPGGWFQIQRDSGIFDQDSGLVIVTSQNSALSSIAAASYVATQFGVRSDTGESRFEKTVLLIPPGQKADDLRSATLTHIQGKMQEAGMSDLMIKIMPRYCDARSLITLAGPHLVEAVNELPTQSACIVLCPELYRMPTADQLPPSSQPRLLDEISSKHLEHLLNELVEASKKNKLMLVLLCDKTRVNIQTIVIPDEINYDIMEARDDDTTETPSFELKPLLDAFREGGWTSVKSLKEFNPDSAKEIAFALSNALVKERNLPLAWAAMEPHIDQASELTVGSQLCIAGAALIAGNMEASHKLLMQAVKEEVQTAEDLFSAIQLANEHDELEIFQEMHLKMCRSFPDIELTQRAEYLHLFKKRDFAAAFKTAEKLGLTTEMAKCRAFASPSIHAHDFLAEMQARGDLEQGVMTCAEEALFRKHACQAIVWARQVQESSPLFERSCIVRFRALRVAFRKGAKFFGLDELEKLTRIVAKRPCDFTLRGEIENLLDSHLEEPLVTVTLSTLLAELIEKQALRDDESIKLARSIHTAKDKNAGAQTEQELKEFLIGFQQTVVSASNTQILVGRGKLDARLSQLVGPNLIRGIAESVVTEGLRENLDSATICLHALCLACNEFGDPSTDFTVLQSVIDYQATMGAAQKARDLADTALRFWPQSQPNFYNWRVSQGWAALAEACLRSGNKMAALRYLCFSLLAHEEPALDVELLRRWYRLASRIFRDLHLAPSALRCIALERSLLAKLNHPGQVVSLEVLEIQIRLPSVLKSSGEIAVRALEHSEKLFQKEVEGEAFALAGIQASILRIIPASIVPNEILVNFQRRVDSMPEPLRSRLKTAASLTPTKEDVAAIIEALPEAQDHHYLAYQITSSLPALSNALRHAVESNDKELFLMAAGAFAQPSLGVQVASSSTPERAAKASSILRTTTLEGLKNGVVDSIRQFSFSRLTSITMSQLQGCLADSEAALVISSEPGFQPCGMLVTRDSVSSPQPIISWSLDSFRVWKATFKERFYWEKPANFMPGFDTLKPPSREIRQVVEGLSLGLGELPKQLTILAASHLFGFTWQLSPHGSGFLTEYTGLAVAPSAAWLVASRTLPWSGKTDRKAWIGSSETTDNTLIALRQYVGPCLQEHCFSTSSDFGPFDFAGSEVAFVGAHGGTGMADYFRSISDRVNHFSPAELARMLAGCGCVILAVCSGGRSDRQSGSEEALGVVSSLFRAGVRCVIAPPWPLDIEVVKYWLPAFLEAMDSGETAGEAAVKARDNVRQELDHPCAWGQMHLYGDQNFRLTPPKILSADTPHQTCPPPK